jgi:HlyD family secretion protein
MSKDIRTGRLGQGGPRRKWIIASVLLLITAAAGWGAWNYATKDKEVEVAVARVREAEFVIAVKTRGEIRSTRSEIISVQQVPDPRITKLAEHGKPIRKGDVVVEFDTAQQEQQLLERSTTVRTVDKQIAQTKASHRIVDEADAMDLMTSGYNLERAKLEASKAEVVSEIEGAKSRIDVGISEGTVQQVKTTIGTHGKTQNADLDRLGQTRDKTVRDMDRARGYLSKMVLRAPIDGVLNVLPNLRTSGGWGQTPPPFKEGDRAWTGAAIAEIPDLSQMRIDLKLDETDRGKMKVGQQVRLKVDAIPDREFLATLEEISPIAQIQWRGSSNEKTFPAKAILKETDQRLRPGMSASAEIVIESEEKRLLLPLKASFLHKGQPAVYVQRGAEFEVRPIRIGKRNDTNFVVLSGLKAGEFVALENPIEAARRQKKL